MKLIRHTTEQAVHKLCEGDADLASGASLADICKKLEVAENTYDRWPNQFAGIKADERARIKPSQQ